MGSTIISLIGAGEDQTIIHDAAIRVWPKNYGELDKPFRFSDFSLLGNSSIAVRWSADFRIDHIAINNSSGGTIIGISESTSGVIDHCTIAGVNANYGVLVSMGYDVLVDDWVDDVTEILGASTAIFLEDNTFVGTGHATIGHGHAHYVARYNLFKEQTQHDVDAHGNGYGPPCGTRLIEVYNNTFQDSMYGWRAVGVRGGAAMIFNNTFDSYDNGIGLHLEPHSPEQPKMYPNDIWIWNNTYNDLGERIDGSNLCGNGDYLDGNPHCSEVFVWDIADSGDVHAQDVIQEGQNFLMRAPSLSEDGFEYTPYTYPHPFVTEGLPSPPTDNEAPTIPTTVTATGVFPNRIDLTWDAATDNVGVTGNDVRRDGTIVATVTGTTYSDTGLSPSTEYTYTVEAKDAAGNHSGESAAITASTISNAGNEVQHAIVSMDGSFGDTPYLYDGNLSTHAWIRADGFWQFYMDGTQEISRVRLYNRRQGTSIRVLVGGTEVWEGVLETQDQWIEITFPATAGDNVRIEGTHAYVTVTFFEVEIWGIDDTPPPPSAEEVQHTIVSMDGEFGDIPYLYDGNLSTHSWIHPDGFWKFYLDGTHDITKVRLYNRWQETSIRVLVGETEVWEGVLETRDEWIEITFPATSGDSVRIEGTHTWASVSFFEVEIWGAVEEVQHAIVSMDGEFGDIPYLYDGNLSTHGWIHPDGFWQFYLDESRDIAKVRLYNRWRATSIRVLVGGTEVWEGVLETQDQWIEITFPPTAGDNVRIEGTHTWAGVSFYEVEIWGL